MEESKEEELYFVSENYLDNHKRSRDSDDDNE